MRSKSTHGFTLIELMSVIAIIGILTTMAVGYTGDWRQRLLLNSTTRHVFKLVSIARAQAIRRGRTTTVHIHEGIAIAFVDHNSNGYYDPETDERLLKGEESVVRLDLRQEISTPDEAAKLSTDRKDITFSFDFEGMCVVSSGQTGANEPLEVRLSITDTKVNLTHTVESTIAGAIRIVKYKAPT